MAHYGVAVLFVNPRGSTGHGDDAIEAIMGRPTDVGCCR
jgi:dipeptidyl aminopeptidase/acylaminoacyl peptidase